MTDPTNTVADGAARRRVLRAAIWLPGLAVALGAAVATAHGLYEVAVAARVPVAIAWLYPLITDGLALVAYAATTRLTDGARRYAWAVVILAAGLSGLAQAAYLATAAADVSTAADTGGFVAPAALRFGVGAWPAIAAAIVAHLLYLLAADHHRSTGPVQPLPFNANVQSLSNGHRVAEVHGPAVHRLDVQPEHLTATALAGSGQRPDTRAAASPARDRARAAARRHATRHGALPTVTELEAAADVSRGTAANVLKHLREHPEPLPPAADTYADIDPTTGKETQP